MRRMKHVFLFSATLLVCIGLIQLVGCSSGGGGGSGTSVGGTNPTTSSLLWSVGDLHTEMAKNPDLLVLDCRKNIADSTGKIYTPYDKEHIEGSHYIDFFIFGDPYPDDQAKIVTELSALGITLDTKICLYDTTIANPQGKVFFQLERQGCTDVHILDGGIEAWKSATGAVSSVPTAPRTPSTFVAAINDTIMARLVDMKYIWDKVEGGTGSNYALIDYREDDLYYGHKICPDAKRTGWIPHSKLLNWRTYFDSTTGLMKPQADLDLLTQAAGGGKNKTNVLICNKGWRTGVAYFALRYAGYPKSSLIHYVGGFREWSSEDDTVYLTETESCYRPGEWMPTGGKTAKRFSGASAQIGDQTYCIGGYQVSTANPPVEICAVNQAFDMDEADLTKQWADLPAMTEPRAFSVGAALEDKVYVIGGLDASGAKSKNTYMYDTTNKTWHTMADLPEAHFSFAAAAVETQKKIYTFGGLTGDGGLETSYSDAMFEYDSVTDTWTTIAKTASWPHGRRCHAMVAIGDTLYLIAGFYKEGNPLVGYDLDDIWTFDTTNPTAGWTEQTTVLPMKVAGHSAAVVNGKIYVPGGWSLAGVKYDVMEYDPVAGTTCKCMKNTRSASIGWPRYWIFMGAYNDEFVSIGGFGGGPGNIATTDTSGFVHFHQPYAYDVTLPD